MDTLGSPPLLFNRLDDILSAWRAEDPTAVALITEERALSVEELAGLVDAQAAALVAATPPGARIGVRGPSSASMVALLYSVPAAGRVLVPLNTRLTESECAAQLRRAGCVLLVGDSVDDFDGEVVPIESLHHTRPAAATLPSTLPSTLPPHTLQGAPELAWIIFTSGSTGDPKGVLLTHSSLAAAVASTAAARPLTDDEVYLYPFPLFHVAAYNVLHAHARQRPVVLPDRFDARRIVELCHAHEVTAMSVAATMLRMILDTLATSDDLVAPPSLRTIAYGAAPMPADLLREAHDVLGCDFAQGYGSTELSGNAVFLGPQAHRLGLAGEGTLLTAAGHPAPGVRLRIVGPDGHDRPASDPGELLVAADQVCAGYLDDPDTTARTIRDGWLHTGDIGTVDANGLLRIVDRAKDIVITGGENVASREVEDVLRSHRLVADAAVIGLPDARWGEAVTAVIVPAEGTAPGGLAPAPQPLADALAAHVAARLAGYKKPRNVLVIDVLPLGATGKVDKPALRALAAGDSRPDPPAP